MIDYVIDGRIKIIFMDNYFTSVIINKCLNIRVYYETKDDVIYN